MTEPFEFVRVNVFESPFLLISTSPKEPLPESDAKGNGLMLALRLTSKEPPIAQDNVSFLF